MEIKRARPARAKLPPLVRRRWARILALGGLLVAVGLAGTYNGMNLVKTGRSMSLKDWVTGVARERLGVVPNWLGSLGATPERLEIDIEFKHFQKLAHKREQALETGHLYAEDDDWVPAEIRHRGETYRVSLRLKGDLSDHWRRPDRWSFKVKVKGGKTLFGMKRFALQDPRTRKFLNEYVMHRLQERLGLIALRDDFVRVSVNGKSYPVFALEENFEKRLIENNERREGPILRYDQWFYWKGDAGMAPELAGSSVRAYQEGSYAPDGTVPATPAGGQLAVASSLLEGFRRGSLAASEVFDVRRLATFFALCDLAGYDHAAGIDNLKFYYDPVRARIEPVGYDFNHIRALEELGPDGPISARVLSGRLGPDDPLRWAEGLFADEGFRAAYVAALERLVDPAFLEDFFAWIEDDLDEKLAILHTSYPWYEFRGREVFERNQDYLAHFLAPECAVQAYLEAAGGPADEVGVLVQSVHVLGAEVRALVAPSGRRLELAEPVAVAGYTLAEPVRFASVRFPLDGPLADEDMAAEGWELVHTVRGLETERRQPVHSRPPVHAPFDGRLPLSHDTDPASLDWLAVDTENRRLHLRPGEWTLEHDVVLPAGWLVTAGGGTTLRLTPGANLVSRSPLAWSGTEEEPIRVVGLDPPEGAAGAGLLVLAAGERSELAWVELRGLDNPESPGWSVTGAVTFFESPVTLRHCSFLDNRCEDALNTVRTDFRIEGCLFRGIRSDAFDADFCRGSILDSAVVDCGGDGVDVSGSEITGRGLLFEEVRDKGLSIGENSRASFEDVTARSTEIAVASKDLSFLEVAGLEVTDCRVGFVAFRKKPEFGAGHVRITSLRAENVEVLHLVEAGSSLWIDGDEVTELLPDVKALLYGAQYGKATER